MRLLQTITFLSALTVAVAPVAAKADSINWTNWNGPTVYTGGGPGSAIGTLTVKGVPITVTYAGQFDGLTAGVNWQPVSTFGGGTPDAPPQFNATVLLDGGPGYTETITFSSPVTNPVLAIWSLGAQGSPASFNFTATEPFSIVSGGPAFQFNSNTLQYAGTQSITQAGNIVYGSEGNGTIEFAGTYSTITFTNPTAEHFYGLTVGAATPEPSSIALLGTGLLSVVGFARRRFLRS